MTILVFGSAGMFGHVLHRTLAERHRVFGTVRSAESAATLAGHVRSDSLISEVSARCLDRVRTVFEEVKPAVVINCIGILKRVTPAIGTLDYLEANAVFPHHLHQLCQSWNSRLIHISTDCVFSGKKGNYVEDDLPDAIDIYGVTKRLGEVTGLKCTTLRTSMIGYELSHKSGLLEWLLSQRGGRVRGYARALFSGWTTLALSRVIISLIEDFPELNGLWHVAAQPISKYDLICKLNERLSLGISIDHDEEFICDRRLNGERFRNVTGLGSPTWDEMIDDMAMDEAHYSGKGKHCAPR